MTVQSHSQLQQQPIQYFEKRKKIFPKLVKGKFSTIRNITILLGMLSYFITPWLRWDRGEGLTDQAVMLDLAGSRIYFFTIEIWPEEVYYLTFTLITAAVGMFFITSLFGRVWCGYTCFHTVWTDIFIKVERLFQGDRNARIKLDKAPWSLKKLYQKTMTHFVWIVIAIATGLNFVLYFNDAPILIDKILSGVFPIAPVGWALGLGGATYLMAGFAREQVCTYMCPYARFQSAMFDNETMIIGYDANRGEPRKGLHRQKLQALPESANGAEIIQDNLANAPQGDCINCKQCVEVCPQGIDIRDGLQLQCIACGLCIDACDNIMEKTGKPKGLIRYDSVANIERTILQANDNAKRYEDGHEESTLEHLEHIAEKFHILRPRTFYYMTILLVVFGVTIYSLATKLPFDMSILQKRNPLFVTLSSGEIRNNYELKVTNKTHEPQQYKFWVEGLDNAKIKFNNNQLITVIGDKDMSRYVSGVSRNNPIIFEADASKISNIGLLIVAEKQLGKNKQPIDFYLQDINGNVIDYDSVFVTSNR